METIEGAGAGSQEDLSESMGDSHSVTRSVTRSVTKSLTPCASTGRPPATARRPGGREWKRWEGGAPRRRAMRVWPFPSLQPCCTLGGHTPVKST